MKTLNIVLLLLQFNPLFAQFPALVKDINTKGNIYSTPDNLTEFNGSIFFTQNDELHGDELWKTDGTETGTILLKDINTGLDPSKAHYFTKSGSLLFFIAFQTQSGWALWKTDGTGIGTVLVKDFSSGNGEYESTPNNLTDVNGVLFFTVETNGYGTELWKSDGTLSGTQLIKDINPGPTGSLPNNLLNVNGKLYFSADDGTYGNELWTSSGTEASTVLLKDINPGVGSSYPNSLTFSIQTISGNTYYNLFFSSTEPLHGRELYRLPLTCTSCSVILYDINTGVNSSYPENLKMIGGLILFFSADDGTYGKEVYRLLPPFTIAGITRFTDINPNQGSSNPENFFFYGGDLYFNAYTPVTGTELFKLNGNTVTTFDMVPGTTSGNATNFHIINNKLIFSCFNWNENKCELWQIPAFGGSPQFFQEIVGPNNFDNYYYIGAYPNYFALANAQLFFVNINNATGPEIWKTDGVNSNLVKDISPGSGHPRSFVHGTNFSYFTADDFEHGEELWRTDGTAANTILVKDINPGGKDSDINLGEIVGNKLIFSANDGQNGEELWVSDGTSAGTQMLLDIQSGNGSFGEPLSSRPSGFTKLGSSVLFFINNIGFGFSLWKTDGTQGGTAQIASFSNNPYNMAILNNEAYFVFGYDRISELWKTNGTIAQKIKTFNTIGNVISEIVVSGNLLYFRIETQAQGNELWVSDGSFFGTKLLKDIYPGPSSSNPKNITSTNGFVYFSADDGTNGRELWKSDGIAVGTVMVKNINAEVTILGQTLINSSNPQNITSVGNTVYFSAIYDNLSNPNYPYYGRELWKTDGTSSGTQLVKDINTSQQTENGIMPYLEGSFAHLGNTIFFPAYDENTGAELWRSNGTATGTFRIMDNAANKNFGLNPKYSVYANPLNNRIYFEGNNGSTGMELWSFEICPVDLSINSILNANNQIQQAGNKITANSNLDGTPNYLGSRNIKYSASRSISLEPGFQVIGLSPEVIIGPDTIFSVFQAEIKACEY